MKCNLPKEKKPPKSFKKLPQYEQDAITSAATDFAYDIVDREQQELQEKWIKLNCILLHDQEGFTEEDLMRHIAGWKRIYARNARMKTKEEQEAWLDAEMQRCFPTCGFPQIRIDELKAKGERK